MKALVLLRSYFRNTKEVTEVIAQQIRAMGHESTVQDLRQGLPDLSDVDIIMIGAPTRMARVNQKAIGILKQLRKEEFTGKQIALFDTYGPVPTKSEEMEKTKKWLYPGAVGIMQRKAKDYGLNVYEKTLRCEVKEYKGPLADGEQDKAASFTEEFLTAIGKKL